MAKELRIILEDKPGALAALAETLGRAKLNMDTVAGLPTDGRSDIRIVVLKGRNARKILESSGFNVAGERDVLVASLQDRPGSLAAATRKLADAGINLDSVYVLGQARGKKTVVFGVPDVRRAKAALGSVTK